MRNKVISKEIKNEITFEDAIAYICKHKSGVEDDEDFKKGIGRWSSQLGMLGYINRGMNSKFLRTWKATNVAYERNKRNKSQFFTTVSDFFFLHILKI